jgi:N-acetylglucosaminyl-diphospho-decaprenol L-rhamnosyltransferase
VFQSNTSTRAGQLDASAVPDVSVVIVSWNVRDLLVRCLEAVQGHARESVPSLQVIVVDNASTDGSPVAAAGLGASVISTGENLGYGRANNLGFEAANGRYVLVLNPDTVPCAASIASLYSFAERQPRAGIVAPRLLNPDGSVQRSAFRFPTLAMAALDLFPPPSWLPGRVRLWLMNSRLNGRYVNEPLSDRPFRCDHPLGAAMLVRREAIERCGGFDAGIFMYSEEIDLAMRFRERGYSCWQIPAAKIVHLGGQSTSQMPGKMFVELWRSRLYLYRKHYTWFSQLGLRALLALAMMSRVALSAVKRRRSDASDAERAVLRLAVGKSDV